MQKVFLIITVLAFSEIVSAQSKIQRDSMQFRIDSARKAMYDEADILKRFTTFRGVAQWDIARGKMDKVEIYVKELFRIAAAEKNDSLLMLSYRTIAMHLDFKTDTKPELEFLFKALKIAEEKYPTFLPNLYFALGAAYEDVPNDAEALKYMIKCRDLGLKKGSNLSAAYAHMATIYCNLDKLDSALFYIQRATEAELKRPNTPLSTSTLYRTGLIYEKLGNDALAEDYYRHSVDPTITGTASFVDAAAFGEYSRFLLKKGNPTQSKYYGLQGLQAAMSSQAKKPLLKIVETLRQAYDSLQQNDSAYFYARMALAYRDSLFNHAKLNAVQDMTFAEEIRQNEEAVQRSEASIRQKHNLQYAAIIVALIAFVILFVLLSRSIIVKPTFIIFFGVLGLLAVFEFINLFIHPYLAEFTHHSPVWMLLILIGIGAMLVPLHHKLEHWMLHVMVEKNKKIRLAAAKKTIATLEPVSDKAPANMPATE